MYTLSGITKTYRTRGGPVAAVRDLDLAIADGEWLAIQGRTGSGKTTLLQLLGAMLRPDSGAIDLDGHRWLFSRHARDVSPAEWGATIAELPR